MQQPAAAQFPLANAEYARPHADYPGPQTEVSTAHLRPCEAEAVIVEIYDQVYQLRGTDPEHMERLATLVDGKMRAVSAHGSTVDSLRVAVLAALNIADELEVLRARYAALSASAAMSPQQNSVRARAGSLMGMLDEVLEQRLAS